MLSSLSSPSPKYLFLHHEVYLLLPGLKVEPLASSSCDETSWAPFASSCCLFHLCDWEQLFLPCCVVWGFGLNFICRSRGPAYFMWLAHFSFKANLQSCRALQLSSSASMCSHSSVRSVPWPWPQTPFCDGIRSWECWRVVLTRGEMQYWTLLRLLIRGEFAGRRFYVSYCWSGTDVVRWRSNWHCKAKTRKPWWWLFDVQVKATNNKNIKLCQCLKFALPLLFPIIPFLKVKFWHVFTFIIQEPILNSFFWNICYQHFWAIKNGIEMQNIVF